jgi:hypothetical protein
MINLSLYQFLKLVGLYPLYPNNEEKYIILLNWLYPLFIWAMLWYYPIFLTVISIKNNDIVLLSRGIFNFIQPFQYYVSFFYFRSQKNKKLYEYKKSEVNIEKCWKYMPEEEDLLKYIMIIGFTISTQAIITFFVTYLDSNSFYEKESNGLKYLGYIFIPFSLIYGSYILTLNTSIFFFSFFQQIKQLRALRIYLDNKKWKESKNCSVATLCYDIFDLRYTLSRMIDKLEMMYIYTTVLGGIGVGLLLSERKYDFQTIINALVFGIMQIFFLIIIQTIGKERDNYIKIIRHRKFASAFILRRNEFCQACLEIQKEARNNPLEDSLYNLVNMTINKRARDTETLKKDIQQIIKNTDVKIDIKDEEHDKKIIFKKRIFGHEKTLSQSIDSSINESSDENMKKQIKMLMDSCGISDPHILSESGASLTTDEFIRCIYEWVSNTGSTIDWIVLNTLLSEDWATFGMFGIEFSDGTALRKALSITIAIIATGTTIGNYIEWI